jgi:hypothetical protein
VAGAVEKRTTHRRSVAKLSHWRGVNLWEEPRPPTGQVAELAGMAVAEVKLIRISLCVGWTA